MPGQQQRDEVIAQLLVALGRVGDEQLRQHVGAAGQVGRDAPVGDLGVEDAIGLVLQGEEAPPRTDRLQPRVQPAQEHQRADLHQPLQQRAQLDAVGRRR